MKVDEVIEGIKDLPAVRLVALMVGFAVTVAIVVSIVLWAQKPSYRMLYGNLSDIEVMEISNALNQNGINYEVNEATGAIMVEASRVHEARMKLAGLGLPKGSGTGYELLDRVQGFGNSQFLEEARYQRAIESELSHTISSLNNVSSARVHLAIPYQLSLVGERKKATASVMVTLYQGSMMSYGQAASIARMVASSIPNLEMEDVIVVDQNGRLLTRVESDSGIGQSNMQFEYRKRLESYYIERIEEILEPIIGVGKVRAQVTADLEFPVEEVNPDLSSISRVNKETKSNGTAPSKKSSRHYQAGTIKRLTAAVVIDEKRVQGDGGEGTQQPLSNEEMEKIRTLVKEAIGFDAGRGDSINVINAPFLAKEKGAEIVEEPSLIERPEIIDNITKIFGILAAVALVIMVIRPVLNSLADRGRAAKSSTKHKRATPGETMSLGGEGAIPRWSSHPYDKQVDIAKSVAQQDPQRAAQVVKEWVESDG